MLNAALFDMDGLMFDTEALFMRLANEAARPLGFAFTEQMILDTLGVNETDCNAYYGSRIPAYRAETFWPAYHAAADRYVAEHGAPQKPYLLETLQKLHAAGVRMAVVSASPRADVLRNLRSAGAEAYFDAIVSGDLGLPGKPQPDMYLRGAALVGVPIAQCAVLEDSPHGLRAGRDAGAYTIMIPDLRPYTDELAPICDCVCLTLREAGEAILCR